VSSEHHFAIGKYYLMTFCRPTPKDKVTHYVKEILNDGDGDGNGDKNSGDGDTFCGDGDTAGGDGAGMGIGTTGTVGDGDKFLSPCSTPLQTRRGECRLIRWLPAGLSC